MHVGPRGLALVLLVAVVPLAGCLGGDGGDGGGTSAGDEPLSKQRADVTPELGGIQGVVTDTAVQPVVGANVTVVELDATVTTGADGSFAVSRVQPGTYTVNVRHAGFVPASDEVTVRAGQVAIVDFLVAHLATEEAYLQQWELVGFFECGWTVGWNVTGTVPAPPEPAPDAGRSFFLGLAMCAVPNAVLEEVGSGNATNDRFLHTFELEPPIRTMVYEMHWEAQSQFAEWMSTNVEIEGFANDGIGRFVLEFGPSPIQVRVGNDTWEALDEEFRTACEEGDDSYCGYNFWGNGWPLQVRVFAAWECASETAGGCVVAQQDFTHVITAFYNAEAPAGYTALTA